MWEPLSKKLGELLQKDKLLIAFSQCRSREFGGFFYPGKGKADASRTKKKKKAAAKEADAKEADASASASGYGKAYNLNEIEKTLMKVV